MARAVWVFVCGVLLIGTLGAEETALSAVLNRVSRRLLQYYERAQTIMATETVRMQPLGTNFAAEGTARNLVYELRLEWSTPETPGDRPEPNVVRRLLTVNGREPKPADEPECEDPRAVAPEPLWMLLPEHRREFGFTLGRPQRVSDRQANTLDYISLPTSATQTWKGDCVSIPLEGRTRGRIWVDAETDDVLRLEEHLVGMVDVRVPRDYTRSSQLWMTLERADFYIEYQPVRFTDPDESVMLPQRIDTLRVFRGSGTSRMRVTQTYSGYRRFLTNSRMLPAP